MKDEVLKKQVATESNARTLLIGLALTGLALGLVTASVIARRSRAASGRW